MQMSRLRAAYGACLIFHASLSSAANYDLSADFSATQNPSGVWSYGAKATLDGPFSLFTVHGLTPADGGVLFQYWQLVPLQEPTLFRNGTSNDVTFGGGEVTIPAGGAYLYSGTDGAANGFGVARFTAPSAAGYRIQTTVRPVYNSSTQGDTDYSVLKNGAELFRQFLSGQQMATYSDSLSLAAGDTLDFTVGRGQDNSGYASGLKVEITITSLDNGPSCTPAPSGLVAWWSGEGNANDSVGGNNGTLLNGASITSGYVRQGFRFDGINDDIAIPDSPSLDLTNEFTVELWFLRERPWVRDIQFFLFDKRDGARANYGASLSVNYGLILYFNGQILFHNPLPTVGVFHHFAGTYRQLDPTRVELKAYLDGALVERGEFPGNLATSLTDTSLRIGSAAGLSDFFEGIIDEVSIYRRGLTDAEVRAIYDAGQAGKCSSISPPVIVSDPQSRTVNEGSSAEFHVTVQGTEPFTYQWLFNGASMTGANGPELKLTNVSTNNAGRYAVAVANAAGHATSAEAILIVVPTTAPPPPPTRTYDLSGDFSAINNPSGVWSYGAKATLDGPFSLFTVHGLTPTDVGVLFQYWQLVPLQEPTLFRNGTSNAVTFAGGQVTIPAGGAYLYSGTDGAATGFGVVRFTAPSAGRYRIQTTVRPVYNSSTQGDTDYSVVKNGGEIFRRFLSGQQTATYSSTVSLTAGETLDFMVGRGQDNSGYGSGLQVEASVSAVEGGPSCIPAPVGLIAWWRGEGNANDSVGGNNGTLLNGASITAGYVGQGFRFDGINDDIAIADSASLDLTNEFTVELWFLRERPWVSNIQFFLFDKRDGPTANYGASLSVNYGLILYFNGQILFHNPLPSVGVFHHFAGVYRQIDPNHVELKTYLDGALVERGEFPGNLANSVTDTSLRIGSAAGLSDFFEGVIDEVSIYRRGLSDGEVQAIYNAGQAGKCSSANAPVIVSQPQSKTASEGASVEFEVTVQGTEPITYQWLLNRVPIIGANGSKLQLTNVTTNDAGRYAVVVANPLGSVTSAEAVLTVIVPSSPPPIGEFDLSHDFSPTDNPAGVWSYGAKPSLNGPFSLFRIKGLTPADAGVLFEYWQLVSLQEPTVFHNGTSTQATVGGGQGTIPPGTTYLYSGTDGAANEFGIIRFTAPASGVYSVQAFASPVYNTALQGDTDFHVVKGGTEVFGQFLSGQQTARYSHNLVVAKGETIDLAVGRGSDRSGYASGLKLAAHVHLVSTNVNPPVAKARVEPLLLLFEGQKEQWLLAANNTDTVGTLDGSQSSDPEGGALDYTWTEDGQPLLNSTGVVVRNRFDLGRHDVTLTVSNGSLDSADTIQFEVITPAEAVAEISARLELVELERRNKRPLQASLEAAAMAFERGQVPTGINLLESFQKKVRAQIQPGHPELANQLLGAATSLINALQ